MHTNEYCLKCASLITYRINIEVLLLKKKMAQNMYDIQYGMISGERKNIPTIQSH